MDWTQKDTDLVRTNFKEVDLIIAADVIYDSSLFDALLSTIRMLFDCCDNCDKFMLVNAVRNPETEREFLAKLGKKQSDSSRLSCSKIKKFNKKLYISPVADTFCLQYFEEPSVQPTLLYWQPNDFSPIKLYSIINQ